MLHCERRVSKSASLERLLQLWITFVSLPVLFWRQYGILTLSARRTWRLCHAYRQFVDIGRIPDQSSAHNDSVKRPRLLSFVRIRPLTAILPQLVLPPPIELKGAGSCSGSIEDPETGAPRTLKCVWSSVRNSAELQPQIPDQSSAQINTQPAPRVATPQAWPAQLVETGSNSPSQELIPHHSHGPFSGQPGQR
jgi:hypothetical protein